MDPQEQKSWQEFDERLAAAEKRLKATANLVQAGMPMLVDAQVRINALIDSDARLYGRLEQLAEQVAASQKRTDEQLVQLAEAQKRTEQSLKAFIDSLNKGGNGSR
jgi:predicted phage gp36 major capsid-like protein